MVGDHTDRDVAILMVTIVHAADFNDLIQNLARGVDFEHIIHALHDARQTIQPHAGINVFLFEFLIFSVPQIV